METWRSQSQPGKQFVLAVGCAAAGLLLVVAARDFNGYTSNAAAGFYLGLLLLLLGIVGCLATRRQTVIIDPKERTIIVEDSTRFGTKIHVILFSNVTCVGIGSLGKASNFVQWYYLILTLKNGERYPLFSPGRFYEGSTDRGVVDGWKQRLETYLLQ
jgi:hypothetical protein